MRGWPGVGCELVLFNGRVHTMDPAAPHATAVAVRGERVLLVGSDTQARAALGAGGEAVDLGGRCVLPGLTDAHMHLSWYSLSLKAVDGSATTLEEVLSRVSERARRAKPGEWILGSGWDHNVWAGLPSRKDLDRAAPGHPVALQAKSGHALWVSSKALEIAGVGAGTPDPPGGSILRSAEGPTGILLENAMRLVQAVEPSPPPDELALMMRDAQAALHRAGLTGVHDYDSIRALQALQLLEARGELTLRVVKGIPRELLPQATALGLQTGFGSGQLRLGALKLFADGALGPQTAWMLEPYEGSSSRGMPTLTEEELSAEILAANAAGIACAVHAIGDGACRAALDAFERARRELGSRGALGGRSGTGSGLATPPLRNRLEHAQLLHPTDLPRLAALGVVASMQPLHATSDMLIADKHWGRRCAGAYAWKSLLSSGAALAFGSDSPVEISDPLAGIHAAVTRRRADGSPGESGWRPAERLTVGQAVDAYTRGAAHAAGRERELGILVPGALADLTVLDRDIFSIDPHEIREARAAATVVGGRFVFRSF